MHKPNLTYINKLSDGDEAFKKKLISLLKKEFYQDKELYFQLFEKKQFTELVAIVHKLKHKLSIVGLSADYELVAAYEKELKEEKTILHKSFIVVLDKITIFLQEI